jgi:hypothetical protein
MILPFMTQAERRAGRRKNLIDHIRLLEERHPKDTRRESVELLRQLLSQIPGNDDNDFQTQSKFQAEI